MQKKSITSYSEHTCFLFEQIASFLDLHKQENSKYQDALNATAICEEKLDMKSQSFNSPLIQFKEAMCYQSACEAEAIYMQAYVDCIALLKHLKVIG